MTDNLKLAKECGAELTTGAYAGRKRVTWAEFDDAQLDAYTERVRAEERDEYDRKLALQKASCEREIEVMGRLKDAPYGPAILLDEVRNAARYRLLRHKTSAGYSMPGSPAAFQLPIIKPVGNIMKGSVAQHLDDAIDAAIRAQGEKDHSAEVK